MPKNKSASWISIEVQGSMQRLPGNRAARRTQAALDRKRKSPETKRLDATEKMLRSFLGKSYKRHLYRERHSA